MASVQDRVWLAGPCLVSAGAHRAGFPLAAFDFDSTLAPCRKRGADAGATLARLRHLSTTHDIAIFTNQAGARDRPEVLLGLQQYVAALDALGARPHVFAALERDGYRKPCTGMWLEYLARFGPPSAAFYCGDAAGRKAAVESGDAAGRKADHSDADWLFARNIGVPFTTPESFFGREPPVWCPVALECRALRALPWDAETAPLADARSIEMAREALAARPAVVGRQPPAERQPLQEAAYEQLRQLLVDNARAGASTLVVPVAPPGSGKSTARARVGAIVRGLPNLLDLPDLQVAERLEDYYRPAPMTPPRRGVYYVDACHLTTAHRAKAAAEAVANGHRPVFVHVDTPRAVSEHFNAARSQLGLLPPGDRPEVWHETISDIAVRTSWARYQPPTPAEVAPWPLVRVPFELASDRPELVRYRYS